MTADRVEYKLSVDTHGVWVTYGLSSDVREGEQLAQARRRVTKHVDQTITAMVEALK